MDIIKQLKALGIWFGIVSLVMGIVLAWRPVETEVILNTFIGAALIIMGLTKLLEFFQMRKNTDHNFWLIIVPILMIIFGIFIVTSPGITMFTIGMLMSIFAFTLGIDRLTVAYNRHKNNLPIASTVLFGIVQIIFAIAMCWNAFAMMAAVGMVTGIYLIINGIMIIASSALLKDLK